jgi:hypothetical protein
MVKPWYRELNIMNRVLNKDFDSESYRNSSLIAFSDVFHPACCMQNYPGMGAKGLPADPSDCMTCMHQKSRASRKGESDEEQ